MSERGIMFAVVAALFAGAFFFPYESDDDYYAKHAKKPAPAPANKQGNGQQNENNRATDATGAVEAQLAVDPLGPRLPGEIRAGGGPLDPADPGGAAPIADQVDLARNQIKKRRGGFDEGQSLEGTWVEIFDAAGGKSGSAATPALAPGEPPAAPPTPSITTAKNPSTITFRPDGTFSEHLLLSLDGQPVEALREDYSGRYALQGFTLSVIRTDPEARKEFTGTRQLDYMICPLGAETEKGMPTRIYVDGKVLKYKAG